MFAGLDELTDKFIVNGAEKLFKSRRMTPAFQHIRPAFDQTLPALFTENFFGDSIIHLQLKVTSSTDF